MDRLLSAKELRASLPLVVERVRHGERFTVLYRSRPAFRVVPIEVDPRPGTDQDLADESLYRAAPVGRSSDGLSSEDHDEILYGREHPSSRGASGRRRM